MRAILQLVFLNYIFLSQLLMTRSSLSDREVISINFNPVAVICCVNTMLGLVDVSHVDLLVNFKYFVCNSLFSKLINDATQRIACVESHRECNSCQLKAHFFLIALNRMVEFHFRVCVVFFVSIGLFFCPIL